MGFLADYAGQKRKKSFGVGAIVLATTIGLASGYCFKSCGSDYRGGENSFSSLESRNLRSLEGWLSKRGHIAGPKESSSDISDLIFDFWKNLPEEEKKEITKRIVKERANHWWYKFRDYCENNLEEISMGLLGGGS